MFVCCGMSDRTMQKRVHDVVLPDGLKTFLRNMKLIWELKSTKHVKS